MVPMDALIRFLADGLVIIVALLAAYGFLWKVPQKKWFFWGWRVVAAGLTSYVTAKIIAHFYQPETMRPFEKLGVEAGAAFLPNPGFPSDHALFAMFLTLAVWYATRSKGLAIIMLVLTVIMGVARVLALVHTPLDVVGGFLIACVGIIWYYYGRNTKKIVK